MGSKEKNILWAPWRMEYILGEKEQGCVFCNRFESDKDRDNLILFRGEHNFVIMNKYPYNNGHLMIVPNRHTADFHSLSETESLVAPADGLAVGTLQVESSYQSVDVNRPAWRYVLVGLLVLLVLEWIVYNKRVFV